MQVTTALNQAAVQAEYPQHFASELAAKPRNFVYSLLYVGDEFVAQSLLS
jgi:hypothetical protein